MSRAHSNVKGWGIQRMAFAFNLQSSNGNIELVVAASKLISAICFKFRWPVGCFNLPLLTELLKTGQIIIM